MQERPKPNSIPPSIETAERSVLGGIFLDNAALEQVAHLLTAESFGAERHQRVYASMLKLSERGDPIDPITMASSLASMGELRALGGVDYIFTIAGSSASTAQIVPHAKIVADGARRRQLAEICEATVQATGGRDATPDLLLRLSESAEALAAPDEGGGVVGARAGLASALMRIQGAYERGSAVTGIPTGFEALDGLTAGFQPGHLIILAGRPSMGKTALALNFATQGIKAAGRAHSVFYASLEMPSDDLWARILADSANVPGDRLRVGSVNTEEIERLLNATKVEADMPLFVDDDMSLSLPELKAKARQIHADPKSPPLGLVIVDYLQLMGGGGRSREQEIAGLSRGLKGLAKELSVPIIALSQLNRSLESRADKRPMMSDLRESGAIEQDADLILFIYRDEVYDKNSEDMGLAEVIISKQRAGGLGTVKLRFNPPTSSFGAPR